MDFQGARRNHNHTMDLGPFQMDKYPVTREDFHTYLTQSNYTPQDKRQYLVGWTVNTNVSAGSNSYSFPKGTGDLPVTSVSLKEARAYCAFYGKRLPQTYEWQLSAQGTDGRKYPWGNKDNTSNYPRAQHPKDAYVDPKWSGPSKVNAFSGMGKGDSIYGVSDLVGNVW
jgi:formylglycine-generating enzyme required for sulfatase activity